MSKLNFDKERERKKRDLWLLIPIAIITTFLAISIIGTVNAADITISPTTPGGLKKAIETAENGSTIYLENGVYKGENNMNIILDKDINIKGKGKNVVIDGQKKYSRLFYCGYQTGRYHPSDNRGHTPHSLNLLNLKITKFYANNEIIDNCGSLNVVNCIFSDNVGAIISNSKNSNCRIINSIFTKNGNDNGIISNVENSNVLMEKCKFNNNINGLKYPVTITIYENSSVRLTDCSFINNNKEGFIAIHTSKTVVISNCTFKKNKNIYIHSGKVKITDSTFTNYIGEKKHKGFSLSSIITNTGSATITNCKFNNNKCRGGVINNYGSMTITKSTFKKNTGEYTGVIHNNILFSGRHHIGRLNIGSSTFISNKAIGGAGEYIFKPAAIQNIRTTLKITNTKFKNNIAGKTYRAISTDVYDANKGKFIKTGKVTKKNVSITPKDGTKVKK